MANSRKRADAISKRTSMGGYESEFDKIINELESPLSSPKSKEEKKATPAATKQEIESKKQHAKLQKEKMFDEQVTKSIQQNMESLVRAYVTLSTALATYAQQGDAGPLIKAMRELDDKIIAVLKGALKNPAAEDFNPDNLIRVYNLFLEKLSQKHKVKVSPDSLALLNRLQEEADSFTVAPDVFIKQLSAKVDKTFMDKQIRAELFGNKNADLSDLMMEYFGRLSSIMRRLEPALTTYADKAKPAEKQASSSQHFLNHFVNQYKAPLTVDVLSPPEKSIFSFFAKKEFSFEEYAVLSLVKNYTQALESITKPEDWALCSVILDKARMTLEVLNKEKPNSVSVQEKWLDKIVAEQDRIEQRSADFRADLQQSASLPTMKKS